MNRTEDLPSSGTDGHPIERKHMVYSVKDYILQSMDNTHLLGQVAHVSRETIDPCPGLLLQHTLPEQLRIVVYPETEVQASQGNRNILNKTTLSEESADDKNIQNSVNLQ